MSEENHTGYPPEETGNFCYLEARIKKLEKWREIEIKAIAEDISYTGGRVKKLEKQMAKYDKIFTSVLLDMSRKNVEAFKKQFRPFEESEEEIEGIERQKAIIERATEILQDNPYESYNPLNLLIHIYWLLGVWKDSLAKVPYLFKYFKFDLFKKFHSDLDLYLRHYEVNKEKWEFIKPETKDTVSRYRRVFEDDLLLLNLGEKDLQIVTKLDSSAYNIPLKLLREILNIKVSPFTLDRTKRYQWVTETGEKYTMQSIDTLLTKFSNLIGLSESELPSNNENLISITTSAQKQYIFIEWLLGMQ